MLKYLKFLKDNAASTAIEYALISSLVAIGIITGIRATGSNLSASFTNISSSLNQKTSENGAQAFASADAKNEGDKQSKEASPEAKEASPEALDKAKEVWGGMGDEEKKKFEKETYNNMNDEEKKDYDGMDDKQKDNYLQNTLALSYS